MNFTFKNLGIFEKETSVELNEFTIICGDNNTGKTYASYAIFGFLEKWQRYVSLDIYDDTLQPLYHEGSIQLDLTQFSDQISVICDKLSARYTKNLAKIFSAHEDFFDTSLFKVSPPSPINYSQYPFESTVSTADNKEILKVFKSKDSHFLTISLLIENEGKRPAISTVKNFIEYNIIRILFYQYFPRPFIISSERTGISLFHRELDINKNIFIERLQNSSKDIKAEDYFEMLDEAISRYARPIKSGIDFVRDIVDIHSKQKSILIKEHPEFITMIKDIIGGEYKVENSQIVFSFRKGRRKPKIPLYMASSTVKSMLELYFYIMSVAKKGDILIIDEPELNLHPKNQRKLAKLFARLVNVGIKVFITTHSDYLIKELNNLIMLEGDFKCKDELLKNIGYSSDDYLTPLLVSVYIAEDKSLSLAPITPYGIEVESFDKEINAINNTFNDITLAKGI